MDVAGLAFGFLGAQDVLVKQGLALVDQPEERRGMDEREKLQAQGRVRS